MKRNKKKLFLVLGILVLTSLIGLISGADPTWKESSYNISYWFNEDTFSFHNFTADLNDFSQLNYFSVLDVEWSEDGGLTEHSDFPWLVWNDSIFSNSTTGIMDIKSSTDDETGNFTINVHAQGSSTGHVAYFEFIINATNDAPIITNLDSVFNLTQNIPFLNYINATDEEEHYPLHFEINFYDNCTHGNWTGRNDGENCTLTDFNFTLTDLTNTSGLMNFTPTSDDVGVYWANFTISDFGENYSCPHSYCDASSYETNKTVYSSVVMFNVFGNLIINASDCQNKVFNENEIGTCQINIRTKGETDELNISSIAGLRNYAASVSNESWFYDNNVTNASSFISTIYINVTPQKTEIGNWTINFTAFDLTHNLNSTEQIYVYVNRTLNDVPDLKDVVSTNASVDVQKRINLTVYDDDFLIPDKLEGYNESISFNIKILNQSDLNQELTINGFEVDILNMPVSGTNRTEAKIEFTPNSNEIGDYTINITVTDGDSAIDYTIFNLTIVSNHYPTWNQTVYNYTLIVNSTLGSTREFFLNLSDGYASDPDSGDVLNFLNSSGAFNGFSLDSNGIINFTPYKEDVGYWNFTLTAIDPYNLQNTTTFIFNISNINSNVSIHEPISSVLNGTVDSNSNINVTEDNYTKIILWVHDDDIMVTDSQKIYYNETFAVNVTIEGPNSNLFSFIEGNAFPNSNRPNRSDYEAIFTPNKSDVGNYNITIHVTDSGGSSDILIFNLTVLETQHSPVLSNLSNLSSGVNRTLYYDFNASDAEDGLDSEGNLRFDISFLQGTDFVNNDENIFNTTLGILNITFNDTQGGIYEINLSVNDTAGSLDSNVFWIYVYDSPNITYPSLDATFLLKENIETNLTFSANHSVGNNLTFLLKVDGIIYNTNYTNNISYLNFSIRQNISYYGNGTNYTWSFTPNFTDETYGEFKNLSLLVYPYDLNLVNQTDFNDSKIWNLNVTHSNAPVNFSGHIPSQSGQAGGTIELDLSSYFSDVDYSDLYYQQEVNFTLISNASTSSISYSLNSTTWILSMTSSSAISERIIVNGSDLNLTNTNFTLTSSLSNEFLVTFTEPIIVTTPTPSTGGGSSREIVSLKIIVPDPVSAYIGDRVRLPITLMNTGDRTLKGINLTSLIAKDNLLRDDIKISFTHHYFKELEKGKSNTTTMIIDINTDEIGTYEITINASVNNPEYYDWGKLYLTVKEGDKIKERLIFTEEFLQENPECIELEEILDEARAYFKQGDFVNTVLKINEAIDGCKNSISQQARLKRREPQEDTLYRYLFIGSIAGFFLLLLYYSYRRMKLSRISFKSDVFKNPSLKTSLILFFIFIFIGLFNKTLTGAVVGGDGEMSSFFWIIFLFCFFGIFVFLKKIKQKKFSSKPISNYKLKNLLGKKVYNLNGNYIGNVNEIIISENMIYGLKISLSKDKRKENVIGIIIKYSYVEDIGEIVIINKDIVGDNLKQNI